MIAVVVGGASRGKQRLKSSRTRLVGISSPDVTCEGLASLTPLTLQNVGAQKLRV